MAAAAVAQASRVPGPARPHPDPGGPRPAGGAAIIANFREALMKCILRAGTC